MSRIFKTESDIFKKRKIELKSGVTVLVGCNGSGKTTLLNELKYNLEKEGIPVIHFDNLHDGGSSSISEDLFYGRTEWGATALCSSEGENIVLNLCKLSSRLGYFVSTGKDKNRNRLEELFEKKNSEEKESIPERWILLDAIDSGLSIDNIIDVKKYLFKTILEKNFGNKVFIIVAANSYELAREEQCFDVMEGKYVNFNNYDEYKQFILKTAEKKEERDADE